MAIARTITPVKLSARRAIPRDFIARLNREYTAASAREAVGATYVEDSRSLHYSGCSARGIALPDCPDDPAFSDDASPKQYRYRPARRPAPSLLHHLLTLLQVAVTVGLLWWLFHDPERRAVMAAALKMADWRWIMLAIVAAGVCEFFGILRWQLFLRMLHIEVPLRETSKFFFIGAFFNQFLPGTTGGDVVRVIFLMQDHPENKAEGFLSVAVDRLLAVLVLVIMGLLFAWMRSDWFASSFAVGHLMKWFAITLFVMGARTRGLVCSDQPPPGHAASRGDFPFGGRLSSFPGFGSCAWRIAAKRCSARSTPSRCCWLIFQRSALLRKPSPTK